MFPWKLLFRFFSATVLLATGGFAAGHEVPLPFASPPEASAPAVPTADPSTTAPDDSNQSDQADDSTTTTTAPDSSAPVVVEPVADPATTSTTVTTTPSKSTTTTTAPKAVPTKGTQADTPPAVPVPGEAPSVCAAAATSTCGPTQPADDTHAARVQRCQDWWNSLADAFDKNGEPQWAAKAREIAGQCDAMITRWEQLRQEWAQTHHKGDHNGDGHPDDGLGPKPGDPGDHPAPPPQPKQVSRHGEGRH